MLLLDANVILRYLLADDPGMADKAEEWIASGVAHATMEVLAEVVYVLQKVYTGFRGCVLCARHRVRGDEIATFDNPLLKYLSRPRPGT